MEYIGFFWKSPTSDDAGLAQVVSSTVVEYIRSMGVDTKIFALASQAGPSDVITLSHEQLLALNVVNDGRKPAKWTVESIPQGLYLKRGAGNLDRHEQIHAGLCSRRSIDASLCDF
jgi:hypothetical protein